MNNNNIKLIIGNKLYYKNNKKHLSTITYNNSKHKL